MVKSVSKSKQGESVIGRSHLGKYKYADNLEKTMQVKNDGTKNPFELQSMYKKLK